jgi:uncharacterized membrane protein
MKNILIKGMNVIVLILILYFLYIQFNFSFIEIQGKEVDAFYANMQYSNIHWGMNYFIFIIIIGVIGFLLALLTVINKHKLTYWYDFTIWFIGFAGIIGIMASLQSFFKENQNLGIKENSTNALYSVLIVILALFISITNLYYEYKSKGKKHTEESYTSELKNVIKDKPILFKATVLLNPEFELVYIPPHPVLLLVTNNEIVISTSPLIIIPFKSIKNFEPPIRGIDGKPSFSIVCENGETYDIIWAPENRLSPYNFDKTLEIYNNIEKIFKSKSF